MAEQKKTPERKAGGKRQPRPRPAETDGQRLLSLYRTMRTLRRFEEKVAESYRAGDLPGFVHLYVGEEAVAAGVCAHLISIDRVTSTHRGHGHAVALGIPPREVMAELWGRSTGVCRGRGGSMHLHDLQRGLIGATGIVGAGMPLAAGSGYASKYLHAHHGDPLAVTVCFFGDGGANNAAFHESLNLAAVFELPVVFVCENNLYATELRWDQSSKITDIAVRAQGYAMPGVVVDGMDVEEVYATAGEAFERARAGGGPTLLECKTYRFGEHYEGQPVGKYGPRYRSEQEIESWKKKDPIRRLAARLAQQGVQERELASIDEQIEQLLNDAVEFARSSAWPTLAEADPGLVFGDSGASG
jgi:TPP-dependent pyruvate/acetoin dehydrogenase alpha subunit